MTKLPIVAGPVMVIGPHGFIGRRILAALSSRGIESVAASRPHADLLDRRSLRRALEETRPAHVVNAARPGGHGPGGADAEIDAAVNLVDAAAAAGVGRVVQLGSGLEYGATDEPIDETTPLRPDTEFGRGKAAASELVLGADGRGGMRTTVLRPFMVYGPGEPGRRLILTAAAVASAGRQFALTRPGFRRDWVFVDDVAEAIVLALGGGADGRAVNLASGREAMNEEVARLASEAVGGRLERAPGTVPPRPWDVRRQQVSTAEAERLIGWRATTPLEAGIALTVAPLLADPGGARTAAVS